MRARYARVTSFRSFIKCAHKSARVPFVATLNHVHGARALFFLRASQCARDCVPATRLECSRAQLKSIFQHKMYCDVMFSLFSECARRDLTCFTRFVVRPAERR